MSKKKSKFKSDQPRHFWILKEFLDEREPESVKVFCTAATAQSKAEYAAKLDGIDVVLILKGNCDPIAWTADDVVQRCEPRPFAEYGIESIKILKQRQFVTRKVGETELNTTNLHPQICYSGLGRFYRSAGG